ncbi:uncharacterized protein LOC120226823 [Hyaena hyaena]|uniref:uncharacterized protein LOC120226823 n=1 Tax=Hyaena hyaena TaxID=95912 RepID=UPI00192304E2|nr:uncharacterized protein LOC120226823 [Hyaena hyaena]
MTQLIPTTKYKDICTVVEDEEPPPTAAPQTLRNNPTLSGRAPTQRPKEKFHNGLPPASPPDVPPTAGGPGFREQKEEFDFPAREGCAAGTGADRAKSSRRLPGREPGLSGLSGDTKCSERGSFSSRDLNPWKCPLRSRGASVSWTLMPSLGQASERTDADVSGRYSPGPSNFPAVSLDRPGAREQARCPGAFQALPRMPAPSSQLALPTGAGPARPVGE